MKKASLKNKTKSLISLVEYVPDLSSVKRKPYVLRAYSLEGLLKTKKMLALSKSERFIKYSMEDKDKAFPLLIAEFKDYFQYVGFLKGRLEKFNLSFPAFDRGAFDWFRERF